GRPLRTVMLVARDPVLWSDVRSGHLQQVELGGHLEERTGVPRVVEHPADVSLHDANPQATGRVIDAPRTLTKVLQRCQFQLADTMPLPADAGYQLASLDGETRAGFVIVHLSEAGQMFEPIHAVLPLNAAVLARYQSPYLTRGLLSRRRQIRRERHPR